MGMINKMSDLLKMILSWPKPEKGKCVICKLEKLAKDMKSICKCCEQGFCNECWNKINLVDK